MYTHTHTQADTYLNHARMQNVITEQILLRARNQR